MARNLDSFRRERSDAWKELETLVGRAGRRPERLGATGVQRLGQLYRETAADLALARRRFPGDPMTSSLEERVGRARHLVYAAPARRLSALSFFARDYWRSVRELGLLLAVSAALLFGSAALAGVWADHDPGAAGGLAPGSYQAVTQPRPHGADLRLPLAQRTGLAGEIFTNNIRVTFLAFAAGLLAGIGSAALLLMNGVMLGVVGGLAIGSGNGRVFFELVTAHGVLELSCITVAGAAGMHLGWGLIEPGRRTRAQALGVRARESVLIVLGTAPWLVVAGLIEGFLTPAGLGLPAVLAIGFGVAAVYWSLVVLLGRPRREPEPSS